MNNDERSGLLYLLAGIGLGTLIGALLGLLFAPKPGVELRQDISERVHDLSEKVKELSQQVKSKSDEVFGAVKDRLSRAGANVEEAIEEA